MNPPTQLHSPLADLERAFRMATRPPAGLTLDGAAIGCDLPSGPLPLDELRRLLLHGHLSYATKDRALGVVAARAQTGDDLWKVGLAGLLMPGLKHVARRLREAPGVDPAEVGPEVVVALLEAITEVDPEGERLAARLCWATYRGAARALGVRRRTAWQPVWPMDRPPGAAVPSTNPEEVIARALKAGVITLDDAELIAQTRLEGQRVIDVAAALAVPASRLQKRRERAESRITEFLHRELAQATGDVSYGHRSHSGPPSGHGRASVNAAGYRSRPGGRLAGLSVSPSDAIAWATAVPTDGGVFARMAAA